MTEKQHKTKKLSKVCSLEAYLWLSKHIESEYRKRGLPYPPPPNKYFYNITGHREYLSKFIESVIVKVLKAKGNDPMKPLDKGTYKDTTETYETVGGFIQQMGSGTWIPNKNVHPGRADVKCFFNGKMYNLEVKVGNDRQSDAQKREQIRAEKNGEIYVIIKTVDDFIDIIK